MLDHVKSRFASLVDKGEGLENPAKLDFDVMILAMQTNQRILRTAAIQQLQPSYRRLVLPRQYRSIRASILKPYKFMGWASLADLLPTSYICLSLRT